jgi:hypothetical protein
MEETAPCHDYFVMRSSDPRWCCRYRLMRAAERPILSADLASALAQAGVDPTLEGRALHDALLVAIATRRGSRS